MLNEETSIHQRLNALVNTVAGGVQRRFATHIGVGSGVIGDIFGARKSKPGFDLLVKILTAYPELRAEWLMLGEGEMLRSAHSAAEDQNNPSYMQADLPPEAQEWLQHVADLPVSVEGDSGLKALLMVHSLQTEVHRTRTDVDQLRQLLAHMKTVLNNAAILH